MNPSSVTHRIRRLAKSVFMIVPALACSQAIAAAGDWQGNGPAQVRLVAAGVDAEGRFAAGIEIALEPGWHTYWRSPGDAGIAPLADFSGSSNVEGPIHISFPVPQRYDDGYSVTNVYKDHVVLLLDGKAADPRASTKISLALDIGVCAEICIPEHYELTLDIPAGDSDARAAEILADARDGLPGEPMPGVFEVDTIRRVGGEDKRPHFEVLVVAPEASEAEVFVEGPVDWYATAPKLVSSDDRQAVFGFSFSRLGSKTPIGGNEFRVTVLSAGSAIEDVVTLD